MLLLLNQKLRKEVDKGFIGLAILGLMLAIAIPFLKSYGL